VRGVNEGHEAEEKFQVGLADCCAHRFADTARGEWCQKQHGERVEQIVLKFGAGRKDGLYGSAGGQAPESASEAGTGRRSSAIT